MQVSAVTNLGFNNRSMNCCKPKPQNQTNYTNNVNFTGENKDGKANKLLSTTAAMAMFLVPIAGSVVTSCDDDGYAYAHAEVGGSTSPGYVVDTTEFKHKGDTIIKWYYNYDRPWPLDSLFNNFQNWDVEGTDGVNPNDSLQKRNIIHYEGIREWEYNNKEIGDMNVLESAGRNLIYDTEITDYKGNHLYYGKTVLRVPKGNFTVTTKDGRVLNSPKGFFYEEYTSDTDDKNASIYDCTLKTRAFCQTNGDTLFVAKRKGTSEYFEKGKAAKGYLGANSILLKNLIGQYETDDHYVDVGIKTVNDHDLKMMYLRAKDEEEE